MAREEMDKILDDAVAAGDVPFVVAMSGNAGGITFAGHAGQAAAGRAADGDTVFRIFSMTKAIGSLAAMIVIDRGQLSMDTAVADILPAWNNLRVLDGWDGDSPVLRPPRTTATIRHLATHRSGLAYDLWNADMAKYLAATGAPAGPGSRRAFPDHHPLVFDPGEGWSYGTGIDWLGQVVEAVDGRRIDAFCQAEIFDPLGMDSTAFEPDTLADRLADVQARGEDGRFRPFELAPAPRPAVYGMGHCLYSTAPDYMRFLRMILNGGTLDGNRILSPAGLSHMLANQMEGRTFRRMVTTAPGMTADVSMPEGTTHSFAFVRWEADVAGRRRAGSQGWAGLCNTHCWVDPAADVAGVIMTQSLPFSEKRCLQTCTAFETAIYTNQVRCPGPVSGLT